MSTLETVLGDLNLRSAAGPTGWTYRLIREFWDLGDRDDFKHATLKIAGLIAQGAVGLGDPDGERGGESAFSYLSRACRLAALPKPDGSPRPIAVGDAFYRFAARCLLKLIGPERINNALLPGQFGVGSKGGVEPLVHALRALLTEFKILKLDFVNSFNEVERGAVIDEVRATFPELSPFVTWVYGTPSDLLVTMDTFEVERMLSQRGVRQGCPLSPLLFSLVMRVIPCLCTPLQERPLRSNRPTAPRARDDIAVPWRQIVLLQCTLWRLAARILCMWYMTHCEASKRSGERNMQ
jgi:hypothetical protein